jgi:hypothetical protein
MSNSVLLGTSVGMLLCHLALLRWLGGPLPLQVLYTVGPCTSILNHGFTSFWTLWADRCVMTVGCVMDLWFAVGGAWGSPFLNTYVLWAYTLCAVDYYFCAKLYRVHARASCALHAASHAVATVSHFAMLKSYLGTT